MILRWVYTKREKRLQMSTASLCLTQTSNPRVHKHLKTVHCRLQIPNSFRFVETICSLFMF